MLLVLLISHLAVLAVGNPFHKYPFVFILDVGNEELEKTNTEQIRVSIPGGSLALRYPAIGDGDTISHVRVSGIDFGTDLKANIVDGGPGYKYVVLVFMGNRGVPYDAVVTIQTLSIETDSFNLQNIESAAKSDNSNKNADETDVNDSAEDMRDSADSVAYKKGAYIERSNAELMQSSSNVHNYAQSQVIESDDYNDDTSNDLQNQGDIHTQYSENSNQVDERNMETEDYNENVEENDQNKVADDPKADKYGEKDYSAYDEEPIREENHLHEKNEGQQHLYDGADYQEDAEDQKVIPVFQSSPDNDESMEFEQKFYVEEVRSDLEKYQDSNNNNYIDSDYNSAVAY